MKIKSVKIFIKHRGLIELERKDILKYFDEDIMKLASYKKGIND